MKVQIPVGHHHALRICSCAGGIKQLCKVIVFKVTRRRIVRIGRSEQALIADSATCLTFGLFQWNKVFRRGRLASHCLNKRREILIVENCDRFGIVEYECNLVGREPYVQRQEHCSGLHDTVISFQQPVTVISEPCYSIAATHSQLPQTV